DGECGFAHEVAVAGSSSGAALGDGPDDKGLAAAVVAGDVDRWFEAREKGFGFGAVFGIAHHAAALVERNAELVDEPAAFSALETKSDEHEVGVEFEVGVFHRLAPSVDHFHLVAAQ